MRSNSRIIAPLLAVAMAAAAFNTGNAQGPTSNIFFYTADPDVDPDAFPLVGRQVPGYVTGITVPFDGIQLTVSRDSTNPETGFAPQSGITVEQEAPASAHVSINQLGPDRTVSFFGEPGIYDFSGAHAVPNPGVYMTPQRVRFQVPDALTSVHYSIDGGAFQAWDGISSIPVVQTTSIAYRGTRGGDTGPTKTVVYTILSLPCSDVDGDGIPDRIEVQIGTDPFLAEGDANGNNINDLDELIRGATTIVPPSPAPDFLDSDGDTWSDYDEGLRNTNPANSDSFPASPSLDTVEIIVDGEISPTSPGIVPPGAPPPQKPYPGSYAVEVLTPGGLSLSTALETDQNYALRTSGEQFHLIRAKALDGSGRQLLAVVPPRALCIDAAAFCEQSATLATWRQAYRQQYEDRILHIAGDTMVDPRSTVAAFLLNRYYELSAGEQYVPGVENAGPLPEVVFELRTRRNEAQLFAGIEAAVTPEMITVVTDYFRFSTSPGEMSMMQQIAAVFAGQAIDPEIVPTGVRTTNFAPVAAQTAAFFSSLPPAETILSGTILATPAGFQLTSNGTIYRLSGLADTFADNSFVALRAIVDIDNCMDSSPRALVTGIVARTPMDIPPMIDEDGDGLDDDWELFYFGNLDEDGDGDHDGDGLSNEEEQLNGTDPTNPDPPIVAGFQGDADLDLFVNAADLVHVQNFLGADYTCDPCRGRGDANGNGHVTLSDLDTVGLHLFTAYEDDPGCTLVEVPCNDDDFNKAFPLYDRHGIKQGSGTMTVQGFPAAVIIGQEFDINLVINAGDNSIKAAGTRVSVPPSVFEIVGGSVNQPNFDVWQAFKASATTAELAGLASADRTGTVTFATVRLRAIAPGSGNINFSEDTRITNIVRGDGSIVEDFTASGATITVVTIEATSWMLY